MGRAPLGGAAAAFALGIYLADAFISSHAGVLAIGLVLLAAVIAIHLRHRRMRDWKGRGAHSAGAYGVLLLCGACAYQRHVHRDADVWAAALAEDAQQEVIGRVSSSTTTRRHVRLVLDDIAFLPQGIRAAGRAIVYLPASDEGSGSYPAGALVSVAGRLNDLPIRRNPADFDYGKYLHRRGVRAVLYPDTNTTFLVARAPFRSRIVHRVRSAILSNIDRTVHDRDARSILSALLLGDRSRIDPELSSGFRSAGLIHLLAVSGLHVMAVGFIFFHIAGPLCRRLGLAWHVVEYIRIPATVFLLLGYMVLTGRPPSVVRAVIMACAFLASTLGRRNSNSVNALFLASVVILICFPSSLFDAGFQLSLSAVMAILTIQPEVSRTSLFALTSRYAGQGIASSVTVSAAATIGVAPVLLFHFGELSLAGLVLNIPAIPMASAALVAGFLSTLSAPAQELATVFARAAEVSLEALISVAYTGGQYLDFLTVRVFPSLTTLVALVIGIVVVTRWRSYYRWRLIVALVVTLAAGCLHHLVDHISDRIEIVFFDVGQGDAALLRTASGRTLLIDAGDARHRGSDSGKRWILPHLQKQNIDRVDILVMTHAHRDHIGGVPSLLRTVRVGRIVYGGTDSRSATITSVRSIADSLTIPIVPVSAGDTLFLDRSMAIHVLWPPRQPHKYLTENDRSVVLRITAPAAALLFLGDVERTGEERIAASYGNSIAAAIVKVAHHGSRTSSTHEFVSRVAGDAIGSRAEPTAIISVAKKNSYGLPHAEIIGRWRAFGFEPLQTSAERAVLFTLTTNGVNRRMWY